MGSILNLQTTSGGGLAPFQFEGHLIRVITDENGEPLFVGRDICDALKYANAADAITKHCKGVARRYPLQTPGGVQDVRVLAEPDVLRLIINCTLPAGAAFERWVFEEVLPTIRRTGAYTPPTTPVLPNFMDPVAAARAWADSEEQKQKLQIELEAAAPAVEFVQRYADATGTKGFRQVCKLLGANEALFREFLIEEKIMYRLGGELTPHAPHIDAGRFCVKTGTAQVSGHAYNAARFTPKGVTWVAGEWAKWQLKQKEGAHA